MPASRSRLGANSSRNNLAARKRPSPEPDRDSPAYIKRKIDASFATAQRYLTGPGTAKHPTRKTARPRHPPMPLVPDLNSFPDSGAYVTIKFATNPVPKSSSYDRRVAAGIFRPLERTEEEEAAYLAAVQDWEASGRRGAAPQLPTNYDFYLTDGAGSAGNFRRKLDLSDPRGGEEELYTNRGSGGGGGTGVFSYRRLRAYETAKEQELDHATKYDEEVLVAFEEAGKAKASFLPVMQRTTLQPQRAKNIARTVGAQDERDNVIDQLDIRIEEPTEEILQVMRQYREDPTWNPPAGLEEEEEYGGGQASAARASVDAPGEEYYEDADAERERERDAYGDEDGDGDVDGLAAHDTTQVAPRGFDEEEDAEGEVTDEE